MTVAFNFISESTVHIHDGETCLRIGTVAGLLTVITFGFYKIGRIS
jgi:hypothetical protein